MSQKTNASLFRRILKTSEWNSKYIEQNKEESSLLLYKDIELRNYLDRMLGLNDFLIMTCKTELSYSRLTVFISVLDNSLIQKSVETGQENSSLIGRKNLITKVINGTVITALKKYFGDTINVLIKTKYLNKQFENNILKSKSNQLEYNKLVKRLKVFRNYPNSSEVIKMALIVITNKNSASLLAKSLSCLISNQKRRHSYIMTFIKKLFTILLASRISRIYGLRILVSGRLNGFPRAKKRLLKIGSVPLQSFSSQVDYFQDVAYTSNGTFGIKVWICGK